MTVRERLIEILRMPIYPHELVDPVEALADYLMDSDVVALPCRIGDPVWAVQRVGLAWRATPGRADQIYFSEDMKLAVYVHRVCRGLWGERVFATQEEAEAEAERRNRNCKEVRNVNDYQ